jgi:hypothetical protein
MVRTNKSKLSKNIGKPQWWLKNNGKLIVKGEE